MSRARRALRKPKRLAEAKRRAKAKKRRPVKAKRSAKTKKPTETKRVMSHALDIEEPLCEALDLMQAFKQIGYGLITHNQDEGRPIIAVARAAEERLNRLHDVWEGLLKAAKG